MTGDHVLRLTLTQTSGGVIDSLTMWCKQISNENVWNAALTLARFGRFGVPDEGEIITGKKILSTTEFQWKHCMISKQIFYKHVVSHSVVEAEGLGFKQRVKTTKFDFLKRSSLISALWSFIDPQQNTLGHVSHIFNGNLMSVWRDVRLLMRVCASLLNCLLESPQQVAILVLCKASEWETGRGGFILMKPHLLLPTELFTRYTPPHPNTVPPFLHI